MVLSVIVLSVSLSLDALFVGFAYGLNGTHIPLRSKLVICLFSILYSGIAVFAGSALARFLPPFVGRLIGALLLAFIGAGMIIKAILRNKSSQKTDEESDQTLFKWMIKPLNITIQILRNPDAGDVDRSGIIDIKEAVLVGSALSIDAIGVGVGSALAGLSSWYIPLAVGLTQLIFLSGGLLAGKHLEIFRRLDERYTSIIPGAFLIVLSFLRLL